MNALPATRSLVAGLIGLAVLFAPPAPLHAGQPARFAVSIHNRKVDAAQQTVRARQGDSVELTFTSDERVELHLHGYDRHLTVEPGVAAVMRVEATFAGRFAIEAHRFGSTTGGRSRHIVLLYLEIHPR